MRIISAILFGFLASTIYSDDNTIGTKNQSVPDSIFALAESLLVNHVGESFFVNHFVIARSKSTPHFSSITWHIQFPEEQTISYEIRFDEDGILVGGIHLPACAENPLLCEIVVDRSSAVTLAESELSAQFVKSIPPTAVLKYERSPWDSFAWSVDGSLVSQDGSERYGAVRINAADGKIVHVYKTESRKYKPDL